MAQRIFMCKQCQKNFNEWKLTIECDRCEDGFAEITRDIDYNSSGYCRCHECGGTGERVISQQYFCSEECSEEYFIHDNN